MICTACIVLKFTATVVSYPWWNVFDFAIWREIQHSSFITNIQSFLKNKNIKTRKTVRFVFVSDARSVQPVNFCVFSCKRAWGKKSKSSVSKVFVKGPDVLSKFKKKIVSLIDPRTINFVSCVRFSCVWCVRANVCFFF